MSIWLFRAGKNGEFEEKFLNDGRVYLTWEDLSVNLMSFSEKSQLYEHLMKNYNLGNEKTAINWGSQIWPMAHTMEPDDWIVLPSKLNRTIHVGKIIGGYTYDESLGSPYYHYRQVDWFALDIPRDNFDQDILYSLGAFMTVCRIHRNNAEIRIKDMAKNDWLVKGSAAIINPEIIEDEQAIDLDEYISDRIAQRIISKYQGYRMEEIIESILKAKGFTTYKTPEGADNGVDILASSGTLGFGSPKICVQVKSSDTPVDRPTLDQLVGTMANFNAEFGLLVSWYGFKSSVTKEIPKQFFKVRLWDSKKIIQELFDNYDKLSDDIKSDIPLKRIWMLNSDSTT